MPLLPWLEAWARLAAATLEMEKPLDLDVAASKGDIYHRGRGQGRPFPLCWSSKGKLVPPNRPQGRMRRELRRDVVREECHRAESRVPRAVVDMWLAEDSDDY